MQKLPILKPGDQVEIVAPASRFSEAHLASLKTLLESFGLRCLVKEDLFGKDLLCAHTDRQRFLHLKDALLNPENRAVICGRGGYGSMRLIPELSELPVPPCDKLFIGMSDITALHIFFQQAWNWPSIHSGANPEKSSPKSMQALKTLLFQEDNPVLPKLTPLNPAAQKKRVLNASITGGNLSLIQASIGTAWQLDARHKIVLMEETGERAYRIDRMLEQITQARILECSDAIILGDFLEGKEPNGTSLIQPVLARFAENLNIPVFQAVHVGHGYENIPLLLGTPVRIITDEPLCL